MDYNKPLDLLIDSSAWISYIRQKINLDDYILNYNLVSNSIIYAELMAGIYLKPMNIAQNKMIDKIFSLQSKFLNIDIVIANKAAEIFAKQRLKGLGHNQLVSDYYIAATCIVHNLKFLTLKTIDLDKIDELQGLLVVPSYTTQS